MSVSNPTAEQFEQWYGEGSTGGCPTAGQWSAILSRPAGDPVTLINFFKFRDQAEYGDPDLNREESTGVDAFNRYASVSIPTMESCGGKFLHVGPYAGTFIGDDEDWDLVAIGSYPNLDALVGLYSDDDYRKAFMHRTAACARQKVLVCA